MKICCLSLVLLLAADQVTAQAPAINAACDPAMQAAGDTATLCASSFCDANTKVCSLLPTATTCDGSNPCVTGSGCPSGTCVACVTADGYEAESTACKLTATGKVGSACTTDGDCTGTTPNTVCGTSAVAKLCSCASGYVTKTSDNTCEIDYGDACTDATSQYCRGLSTCISSVCKLATGAGCDSSTASHCTTGTTCDTTANRCLIAATSSCAGNTELCISGASCVTDTCTCNTTVSTLSGTACTINAGEIGGACSTTADCTDNYATCINSVCYCSGSTVLATSSLTCAPCSATAAGVSIMMVLAAVFTQLAAYH